MPHSDIPDNSTRRRRRYEEIRYALLTDILHSRYRPGDRLPSELKLSSHFGTSRLTVRRAIRALADQGYVRPLDGRGYEVVSTALSSELLTVISLSHYLAELGVPLETKLLETCVVKAQPSVAEALRVPRGANVIKIVRHRFAAKAPIAVEESYYDAGRFANLLEADLDHHSLIDTLFRVFDLRIGHVTTTLAAGIAGEVAGLLGLAPTDPILISSATLFDLAGAPVEFSQIFYHGQRMRFTFVMETDSQGKGAADSRMHEQRAATASAATKPL